MRRRRVVDRSALHLPAEALHGDKVFGLRCPESRRTSAIMRIADSPPGLSSMHEKRGASVAVVFFLMAAAASAQWTRLDPDGVERPLERLRDALFVRVAAPAAGALWGDGVGPLESIEAFGPTGSWILRLAAPLADRDAYEQAATAILGAGADFVAPVFADSRGRPVVPLPDLLVGFSPGADLGRAAAHLRALAPEAALEARFGAMPEAFRLRAPFADGGALLDACAALWRRGDVRFAEPDWLCRADKNYFSNDPRLFTQWSTVNYGQTLYGIPDVDCDVTEAWDISTGASSVRVAVIDDGVELTHADLAVLAGVDTTYEAPALNGGPNNLWDSHGTWVAGVIGARMDNGYGVAGAAPRSTLFAVRAYVSTSFANIYAQDSAIVAALAWCELNGVAITNNSVTFSMPFAAAAAKYAQTRQAGMLHFAAAGNDGTTAGPTFPANLPDVRAVVALDFDGQPANFATTGPGVDFAAPGVYVQTTDLSGAAGSSSDDFIAVPGSSFATAYAAAIAALVLAVNPALGAADVDQILESTAFDDGIPGYDTTFGWGALNAHAAAFRAALLRPDPEASVYLLRGDSAGDCFGAALTPVGDVDSDGTPDFAVGAPLDDAGGADAGRVVLISGRSGFEVFEFLGAGAGDQFGASLAAADFDGDGIQDLAVGAPHAVGPPSDCGRVQVFSGADGHLLWQVNGQAAERLGVAVAVVADLDGDGVRDLACGAPAATVGGNTGIGRVLIRSGATGQAIVAVDGTGTRGERGFGAVLAAAPDRNGDGVDEILVGAPDSAVNGVASGTLAVVSGATFTRLETYDGGAAGDRFGAAMTVAGDLDGDTVRDIVAGAPGAGVLAAGGGAIAVISSLALSTFTLENGVNAGDALGSSLLGLELGFDTIPDVAFGVPGDDAGGAESGTVLAVDGATTRVMTRLFGAPGGRGFGAVLAALGDVDHDTVDEFLAAMPGSSLSQSPGEVVVVGSPNPSRLARMGPAGRGTAALSAAGPPPLLANGDSGGGDRIVEVAVNAPIVLSLEAPSTAAAPVPFILCGFAAIPAPLDAVVLPQNFGTMAIPPAVLFPGRTDLITICDSVLNLPAALPPQLTPFSFSLPTGLPIPLAFSMQAAFLEPGLGVTLSNLVCLDVR